MQPSVDGFPRFTAVVGTESTSGGNGNEHPIMIAWVNDDRMQAHPSGARGPFRSCAMAAESGEFLPRLPAVGRAKQRSVFDPGVNSVRVGQRRFQMPDSLKFPRMLCAVVPLVCGEGLPTFG